MGNPNSDDKQKVVANIWIKLIDSLNERMSRACLSRDAFLDRILEDEVRRLSDEIAEPNDSIQREAIESGLNKLPRKPVSFSLRQSTVQNINAVCNRLNIPRDAMFNRLYFMLIVPPTAWDQILGVDDYEKYVASLVRENFYPGSYDVAYGLPIRDIDLALTDPFWGPMKVIEAEGGSSLSKIVLDGTLLGKGSSTEEKAGMYGLNYCLHGVDVNPETLEAKTFVELFDL